MDFAMYYKKYAPLKPLFYYTIKTYQKFSFCILNFSDILKTVIWTQFIDLRVLSDVRGFDQIKDGKIVKRS